MSSLQMSSTLNANLCFGCTTLGMLVLVCQLVHHFSPDSATIGWIPVKYFHGAQRMRHTEFGDFTSGTKMRLTIFVFIES